ncbi:MAG: hypothetical protein KA765_19410, partial [Thermoflexales bacterium]|nr:hypothetical protein [Thermoflexales bacterium]
MSRSPARRRYATWSVWLLIVSWLLTACGPAATPTPAAPAAKPTDPAAPSAPAPAAEPAVLKLGWLGKPDTLNPAYA